MSVQKRKQAKAVQSLATKLPLASIAGVFLVLYGASQAFGLGDGQGLVQWVYGVVGGVVGFLIFGVVQKPIKNYEHQLKIKARELAQKMEAKIDEEQGGINKLLDSYELHYVGGHPGWPLRDKAEFGLFDIHEKSIFFKNKSNRVKLQLARVKRVTLEPEKVLRLKKLPSLVLPKPKTYKNAIVSRLMAEVAKRQRYLVVDYLDDLGEKHLVVFQPVGGNPFLAKTVKAAIDEVHRKIPKEKRGASEKPAGLQQASDEALAAAEAASRRSMGYGTAPMPQATASLAASTGSLPAEGGVRYQVVLDHAGATPEEQAAVATQMASLFGIPADKAMAAVQRVPFVAKRNLTADQAQRLVSALTATGASARSEAMNQAPVS